MKVEITFYGQLADFTGCNRLVLENTGSTEELLQHLYTRYPVLAGKKFRIAVNNQLSNGSLPLPDGAKISLLPPFSGG